MNKMIEDVESGGEMKEYSIEEIRQLEWLLDEYDGIASPGLGEARIIVMKYYQRQQQRDPNIKYFKEF